MNIRLSSAFLTLSLLFTIGLPHFSYAADPLTSDIVSKTNVDRLSQGLTPLTENALLTAAAQRKALDMLSQGYFAHTSPAGKTPWYWFTQVGYHYTRAGENLALDYTDATSAEAAWMNSPTHRANILKPSYTQTGVGVATGMYQGKQATVIVALFATPARSVK